MDFDLTFELCDVLHVVPMIVDAAAAQPDLVARIPDQGDFVTVERLTAG